MAFLMSLRAACLANLQAISASGVELLTSDGCGRTPCVSLASLDRASVSLRTRQLSLLSKAGEPGTELFQAFPRSAMIVGGTLYPVPPLVLAISGSVSSSLLPTITARDWKDTPGMATATKDRNRLDMLPRRLFAALNAPTGFKLNPRWCLWFMGYPVDWLKPLSAVWATLSSRRSSKSMPAPSRK